MTDFPPTATNETKHTDIAVYIMTHGPACTWLADYCVPMELGAACRHNHCCELRDDTGDNISNKDNKYCELTGLYWMWKNDTHNIIGLYHYRRVFNLSAGKIRQYLKTNDIIVTSDIKKPTIEEEYYSYPGHVKSDWLLLKSILHTDYPDYSITFEKMIQSSCMYGFNMFITRREILNAYCEWLFPILSKIESAITMDNRTPAQKRVFGYLSERLFHLYIEHNHLKAKRVNISLVPPYYPLSPKCPKTIQKLLSSNIAIYTFSLKLQDSIVNILIKTGIKKR
ncbi:MAG TPA: DUF4422 domain-containing protein [Methanocorpusculum sp.]|nr:DUF4422 domain-containing protein [Methanocorpusculum sp.]